MSTPTRERLQAQRRLMMAMGVLMPLALLGGLVAGSDWSLAAIGADLTGPQSALIVGEIRLPRVIGACLVGALLGLAGAIAQGLFRNPLADPYLLGSASGATLGVVLVLAAGSGLGHVMNVATVLWLERLGLVLAAFLGALGGVLLTLLLARGATQTARLLLTGLVVGVMLGAASDLVTTFSLAALRGKQVFMLGNTAFLSWQSCGLLSGGLLLSLLLSWPMARALDALSLGEDTARSLGLRLSWVRLWLVVALALCTGLAVSQAGLVAFVGLVAPHLVRRFAPAPSGFTLIASAATGGLLLLLADALARSLMAPQELPVGILTAVLGGGYLLRLLSRRGGA